jgi:hypothetical protein
VSRARASSSLSIFKVDQRKKEGLANAKGSRTVGADPCQLCHFLHPFADGQKVLWSLSYSVPPPATVKTAAAKYEQDNEDDQ